MVWGYRWSGANPSVLGMMQAVQAADTRLAFTPHPLYSNTSGYYAVYSIFYDLTGLGGAPVVGFPGNLGGMENGYPPYAGDHYREGWLYNGFWGELIGQGNPYNGGSWSSTVGRGIGFDTISNNSWYALSFSTDEKNFTIPSAPIPQNVPAVPEPATVLILAAVTVGIVVRKRKQIFAQPPSS